MIGTIHKNNCSYLRSVPLGPNLELPLALGLSLPLPLYDHYLSVSTAAFLLFYLALSPYRGK